MGSADLCYPTMMYKSGNSPISKALEVLGLTSSSWALWRHERSATIGSFIEQGLLSPVVVGVDHFLQSCPVYSLLLLLGQE